jgi:hypothetical protein
LILQYSPEPRTGIVVVYDLREPDSWEQAREDRRAWGKELTEIYTLIYTLDNDHVIIAFKPGAALEAAA